MDAANFAPFVAPEPKVGAAMRAMLIDDSDPAARVAEAEQRLAHQRPRTALRQQPVVLRAKPAQLSPANMSPLRFAYQNASGIATHGTPSSNTNVSNAREARPIRVQALCEALDRAYTPRVAQRV
jgi:hypothetical protein